MLLLLPCLLWGCPALLSCLVCLARGLVFACCERTAGTSKSQLLGFVHKIAPRGMYTSGKGSSAVGLTAYITKDPDTKEPVLESGALVRCVLPKEVPPRPQRP